MRLVQITIPAGKRAGVLSTLDEEGIDYVVTDETSGRKFTAVAYFPLPANAVEPILDSLREAGIDEEAYTVVVEANTVVSRRFEELEDRYAEEVDEDRIAREELTSKARDLAPATSTYVTMTVVSAVIATAGLLLDSPAVVVGSMVIAPLIGPAMAASVGTVVDDQELFERGVLQQIGGVALSIVSAALFAGLVRFGFVVPPGTDVTAIPAVQERLAPGILSLIVAVGAGIAGVVSLATGVSTALVGVMIAVALIPPAATVGIGIAWGLPAVSLGAGVLTLVNLLSINLAALIVLRYMGYRPAKWFRLEEARIATFKRIVALAVAVAVLSAFLVGITYQSYQQARTTEQIHEETAAVLAETTHATFLELEVEHSDGVIVRYPARVIVTVGVPPDVDRPGLAARLDDRLDATVGRDVQTQLRYVTMESA